MIRSIVHPAAVKSASDTAEEARQAAEADKAQAVQAAESRAQATIRSLRSSVTDKEAFIVGLEAEVTAVQHKVAEVTVAEAKANELLSQTNADVKQRMAAMMTVHEKAIQAKETEKAGANQQALEAMSAIRSMVFRGLEETATMPHSPA